MLMKVSDVANQLGLSESMVYQLVYSDELPRVQRRKGCAVRIKSEDVDKYIQDSYINNREKK